MRGLQGRAVCSAAGGVVPCGQLGSNSSIINPPMGGFMGSVLLDAAGPTENEGRHGLGPQARGMARPGLEVTAKGALDVTG